MEADTELLLLLLDFVTSTKERKEEWAEFAYNNGSEKLLGTALFKGKEVK